jgi:hypothetical protein
MEEGTKEEHCELCREGEPKTRLSIILRADGERGQDIHNLGVMERGTNYQSANFKEGVVR